MRTVEQLLLQLNTEKRRWRRAAAILTALSLVVALFTGWNLRMTGITLANSADCGLEEHRHTPDCQSEDRRICGLEEHTHSVSCYSDLNADLETSALWEATLPTQLSGRWSADLASVARSQVGYRESEANYILAADGVTRQGMTRYGQWYGNPYGDWAATFIAFCLNYANVPQSYVPRSAGVSTMTQLCESKGILSPPDGEMAATGNLLFLDTDDDRSPDQILIVTAATKDRLLAVGGDLEHSVAERTLFVSDPEILGYVGIGSLQPPLTLRQPLVLAATDGTDLVGSFLTTADKNSWQIVSGGYVGRESANKQGTEDVLIQKNVVPTGVENEFFVYLSISKKLSWNTVLEYGTYLASSSNSGSVGDITSLSGSPTELTTTPHNSSATGLYMVIQVWNDSKTQLLSETDVIMRYTDKTMKNGRILLQIPGSNQGILVAKIKDYQGTSVDNPVYIQLTESIMETAGVNASESISVIDTVLDRVQDTMGDSIEFVEILAGDYAIPPSFENGVLTWYPKSLEVPLGKNAGEMWQENAAQLVYKIRLKNDKSCRECLGSSCSPDRCDHVVPVHTSSVLEYHFSNESDTPRTLSFQTPYLRGLLYDVHFTKVDADFDFPLKGAVFRLTKDGDRLFVPLEVTSGASGEVSFENLLPGTYALTEIAAPTGYEITFGDARNSIEIQLSYTENPELLTEDLCIASQNRKWMYRGSADGEWRVTNQNTEIPVALPATGGMGSHLFILGGLVLILAPFWYCYSRKCKFERRFHR